jgi:hypothetical protein
MSDLLARASRERQLTRREQLGVVFVSHIGIFAGAFLICWGFDLGRLPGLFILGEIIILVSCGFLLSMPELRGYAHPPAPSEPSSHSDLATDPSGSVSDREDTLGSHGKALVTKEEKAAAAILIGASIVQFGALAVLLWRTGGPIESPFAEMTLAIAVFTPFLANKSETVAGVVVASVAYYALLILFYINSHPGPDTAVELKESLAGRPSVWAYFWVNVMILIGATAFTIVESLARSWEAGANKVTKASVEPAQLDDPPPPAEA